MACYKFFKTSVECFFDIFWKTACRQFIICKMIGKAIAANPFSAAWLVSARAFSPVEFLFAFHHDNSSFTGFR